MEASPVLPPSVEQPSSSEKKESRKRKKKNVENLGTFIVEKKPREEKERAATSKKAERFLKRINERDNRSGGLDTVEISQKLAKENDKTPELDGEAPLEHLSRIETMAVNQNLGKARSEEITHELDTIASDTAEAQQAKIAQEFIAFVSATGDPELAARQVAEAHSLGPIELSQSEIIESSLEEPDQAVDAEPDVIDTRKLNEGEIYLNSASHEIPDNPLQTAGSAGMGGSGIGGGSVPPSGEPLPSYGSGASGSRANTAPDPNTISTEDAHYYERQALSRGVLVGGIVGYLIGRRRGRIKTEKKLLPIQKKLHKEVEELESRLIDSEYAVRRAVAQRDELQAGQSVKRSSLAEQSTPLGQSPERSPAPEAPALQTPKVPLERIGHVIVAAEASAEKQPQALAKESSSQSSEISAEQQAMTMSRSALLELSEKVMVDGTSLRQVYETHLVSERGLRRLVAEYLRGGNVQRVLRRELIEREIDFERDPILRDRARASLNGGGKGAVSNLLQEAGAGVTAEDQAAVPKKQPSSKKKATTPVASQTKQHPHAADVTLITIIVVLLTCVAFLAFRGH